MRVVNIFIESLNKTFAYTHTRTHTQTERINKTLSVLYSTSILSSILQNPNYINHLIVKVFIMIFFFFFYFKAKLSYCDDYSVCFFFSYVNGKYESKYFNQWIVKSNEIISNYFLQHFFSCIFILYVIF